RWPSRSPESSMPLSKEQRRKRYAEDPEYRKRAQEASLRHYAAHKAEIDERKRRANLLKRFGMSWREYELRLALQGGAGAICRKNPERRFLCVDHCHKTGKVRGVLCTLCNAALGGFGDDPKRMQAATDYLAAFYASLEPRGEVVASPDGETEAGTINRLLREA